MLILITVRLHFLIWTGYIAYYNTSVSIVLDPVLYIYIILYVSRPVTMHYEREGWLMID